MDSDTFEQACVNSASGLAQKNLSTEWLKECQFPLPPLQEQQRIVAKLDEQMAALDCAEKALAEQQAAASVLTAAVLRGILASPFSGTWPLVSLREASHIISKGTTPTSIGLAFSQSGIPFIRAEDIQGEKVDVASVRMHIDEPTSKVLARSSLQPGDLLVTIAGTLGRVGYVPDDTGELNCNQAVAFVRLKPDILDVQYACISLQNGILASRARADGAGNSIQNMSLAQLGELTLPVPPLAVQRQLVSSMRAAQDRVKWTLTSIEGRLAAATVLKAALLDAAFSGEV
jgi:restriction endonuclease S subunit